MTAVFVELPAFSRYRSDYFDDAAFRALQDALMRNPRKGDLMPGTGGLAKLRCPDRRRRTGKRGGLRVIYYWWTKGMQFWLFTVYAKDEMADLTPGERKAFSRLLERELATRSAV
jgi:hypothetical protein